MNVGLLLPGFSADEHDWAIPVQLNLVREMARCDDVRVLALRYPHVRDVYRAHGATVYSLGAGQARGRRRLALWADAIRTLRRLHQEKPFDLLHAMWADETGLIAAWAGRWMGVPVVVSAAGGELVRFDDIGYGLQRSAFSRWIVGQALLGAQRVVVACSHMRRLVTHAGYGASDGRIRTIALGVDTGVFCPDKFGRDVSWNFPATAHLIHVGSLVAVKDQGTLLRAVALLDGVTLDIVGEGPEGPRLERLAAQLGIATRIRFLGAVRHLDLPAYYRRAALNVLTSRHEGLGMVTLEAAACGVPTVSTAVGLLPDYLQLGVTVPVGDPSALAAAILSLLEDRERLATLRKSAYETATSELTIQRTVQQLRTLYAELQNAQTANPNHPYSE